MKRKKVIILLSIAVLLFPVWMWLAWWLTPKRKLTVAIIDKTSMDRSVQKHISLDWVLNQQRFAKNHHALYSPGHDYFGFFPEGGDHYRIKGLERWSSGQLQQLAGDADMVYFADTYGVYKTDSGRSEILYGGMSQQDIGLLQEMKARHKLMIAEFNAIGSPTRSDVRQHFESLFGLHWSGWTARYFTSLDTLVNPELPHWLIDQYRWQHGGEWPFHRDGIVWVNSGGNNTENNAGDNSSDNSGDIVILENGVDLTSPVPEIAARQAGLQELDLPTSIKYSFWFDVIEEDTATGMAGLNEAAAEFVIPVNARGAALLQQRHIPVRCPAVLRHQGADYSFYYFSGDFCNNPLSFGSSYFKGIGWFKRLFYHDADPGERQRFFWSFYRLMMTRILEDEYRHISSWDMTGQGVGK
jgi:hypothetical protein